MWNTLKNNVLLRSQGSIDTGCDIVIPYGQLNSLDFENNKRKVEKQGLVSIFYALLIIMMTHTVFRESALKEMIQ